MLKRTLPLILIMCFSTLAFAQQSWQVSWGKVMGTDDPGNRFSIQWSDGGGLAVAHVLRMNYSDTRDKSLHNNNYVGLWQMEVLRRWHGPSDKKFVPYVEAGIAGMVKNARVGHYAGSPCGGCFNCDCLVSTPTISSFIIAPPANSGYLSYGIKEKNYRVELLPGTAIGLGGDVRLSEHYYVGFHSGMSLYYSIVEGEVLHYITFGLNTGFWF